MAVNFCNRLCMLPDVKQGQSIESSLPCRDETRLILRTRYKTFS